MIAHRAGECANNPGYMLGGSSGRGACRLACKECTPCKASDTECIKKNREAAGYMHFDSEEFGALFD